MGDRIDGLQRMVVPKLRRARNVAITMAAIGAGVVVVGSVAAVAAAARRRRRHKRELAEVRSASKSSAGAKGATESNGISGTTRDTIKAELRDELRKELELAGHESRSRRLLSTAVKSGASAAIPIIIKQLEKRA